MIHSGVPINLTLNRALDPRNSCLVYSHKMLVTQTGQMTGDVGASGVGTVQP